MADRARAGRIGGDEQEPGVDSFRSAAQLNMLHSLAAKLNGLGSVEAIGEAIAAELRTIVEYHNCRVYLLQRDGRTLLPIAFRGEYFSEYEEETLEELVTEMGEGMTGWVAETGRSLLTPNAQEVEFAVQIEGTDDIVESMLLVPTKLGSRVNGVIVLSSIGYGKFDEQDQQVVEVLAPHAAAAFDNATLLAAEREAARTSAALLELSQSLVGSHTVGDIFQEAIETIPSLVPCAAVAAYVHDEEAAAFRVARLHVVDHELARHRSEIADVPAEVADSLLFADVEPFTVDADVWTARVPRDLWIVGEARSALVAPLRWEPDGSGAIVMIARDAGDRFDDRAVRLAHGIANIASLALGTARRLSELERFQELVDSLDAVFWEADAKSLGFTFLAGRVGDMLGADTSTWPERGRSWGDHIVEDDRASTLEAVRATIESGEDRSLDYRVTSPDGGTSWIRDVVHVVRGAQGPRELRGVMVDITERERAELALRTSERKYSEAFRREREATQRLRSLDEMKNTFLEAVSHDLRTPLTSILGSAVTLENAGLDLPPDDALDLIGRIAANARKLERLLGDLLDLDRLQRGIIAPQRRPTDLAALVARAVEEADPNDHEIETDVAAGSYSLDAAKVERIVENLVSNALRHTPAGTRVWVRAGSADGGVLVIVEDAGPGVPEELHDAVFEPFRQAPGSSSEHSPGVGIGLSLVRRFAELHGGRAWVEARDGGGASFHVFLAEA